MKINQKHLREITLFLLVIWCVGAFLLLASEAQLEPRITSRGELMLKESSRVLIVDGQPIARVHLKLLQEEVGYILEVKVDAATLTLLDGVLIFDNEKLLNRVRFSEGRWGINLTGEISSERANIVISRGANIHRFSLPFTSPPSLDEIIGSFLYIPCRKAEKAINIPLLGRIKEKVEPINLHLLRGVYLLKRDVGGFKSLLVVRRCGEVLAEGVLLGDKKIWLVEEGEEEILEGVPLEKLMEGENESFLQVLERMRGLWEKEGFLLNFMN